MKWFSPAGDPYEYMFSSDGSSIVAKKKGAPADSAVKMSVSELAKANPGFMNQSSVQGALKQATAGRPIVENQSALPAFMTEENPVFNRPIVDLPAASKSPSPTPAPESAATVGSAPAPDLSGPVDVDAVSGPRSPGVTATQPHVVDLPPGRLNSIPFPKGVPPEAFTVKPNTRDYGASVDSPQVDTKEVRGTAYRAGMDAAYGNSSLIAPPPPPRPSMQAQAPGDIYLPEGPLSLGTSPQGDSLAAQAGWWRTAQANPGNPMPDRASYQVEYDAPENPGRLGLGFNIGSSQNMDRYGQKFGQAVPPVVARTTQPAPTDTTRTSYADILAKRRR